ncbi:MAG: DNA glycosylase [Candidatus Methylacidiphilales bacterium]|nr:DNA glycosylase [Candidatus Methylacidiphilales bacterium]
MFRIEAPDFDLHATLDCGQTFSWECLPDRTWQGWIHGIPCLIRQCGDELEIEGTIDPGVVRSYFALDDSWASWMELLPADPVVRAAAEACRGLRCIQDPWWECTANFICSSLKQIPQIRRIHRALRAAYSPGIPVWPGAPFPGPATIATAPESILRAAGLGYRARHLHRAATHLTEKGFDFASTAGMPIEVAARKLCELPGVGDKVAHCILLYAGRRYDAFPLDVWMIRLIRQHYRRPGRRLNRMADLHRFALRHLGPHRGLAQLYLFHDGRSRSIRQRAHERPRAQSL